jgi:hypothetical protein
VEVTGAHSSGVSIIFSTTSWKASVTPTAVFADASMKSEFMRVANTCASAVGTCRENSCADGSPFRESWPKLMVEGGGGHKGAGGEIIHLVHLVAN